jgi:hypothetical protein
MLSLLPSRRRASGFCKSKLSNQCGSLARRSSIVHLQETKSATKTIANIGLCHLPGKWKEKKRGKSRFCKIGGYHYLYRYSHGASKAMAGALS